MARLGRSRRSHGTDYHPNGAATENYTGNPTQVGMFTLLVTVMDSEPGLPAVTASTTFTIVINQDPAVKRLP